MSYKVRNDMNTSGLGMLAQGMNASFCITPKNCQNRCTYQCFGHGQNRRSYPSGGLEGWVTDPQLPRCGRSRGKGGLAPKSECGQGPPHFDLVVGVVVVVVVVVVV